MCHVDFLILAAHAQREGHLVFDYQLPLLKPCYGGTDFLEFLTAYAEKVFDYLVVDCLLLHDQ